MDGIPENLEGSWKAAKLREKPAPGTLREPIAPRLTSTAALFASRCIPLRVGEIQLDAQGRIRPCAHDGPLRFGFAYRGVEYGAEVETGSEPRVRLSAELGKLPYSMKIGDGRRLIRRIILASACSPRGRIGLSEAEDMRLEVESTPPLPFTPVSLIATLAALLLDFRPYLDLLGWLLDASRRDYVATG